MLNTKELKSLLNFEHVTTCCRFKMLRIFSLRSHCYVNELRYSYLCRCKTSQMITECALCCWAVSWYICITSPLQLFKTFSLEIIQNGIFCADGWLLSSLLLQQHPSQFYLHLYRSHPRGFLFHHLLFSQVLILFHFHWPVLSFPHQLLSQFHALIANQLQSQEAILVLLVPDRWRGYQCSRNNNPHISNSALMDTWTEEIPESGVSRGPFELVLFVQMNSEAVASGETLITYMALVASSKPPLVSHGRPMKNIKWHIWEENRQRLYFLLLFTSCSRLWWSFMVLRAREVKLQPVMSQWKVGSLLWVSRCLRKSIKFLHLGGKQRNGWNG